MTTDLIKKLEALTGPDRELDAELEAIFVGGRVHYNDPESKEAVIERPIGGFWIRHITPYRKIKRYTSSVDAAIALAERVLPGWGFFLRSDKEGHNCGMVYPDAFRVTPGCGSAASAAISMCIAILKAKDASHD